MVGYINAFIGNMGYYRFWCLWYQQQRIYCGWSVYQWWKTRIPDDSWTSHYPRPLCYSSNQHRCRLCRLAAKTQATVDLSAIIYFFFGAAGITLAALLLSEPAHTISQTRKRHNWWVLNEAWPNGPISLATHYGLWPIPTVQIDDAKRYRAPETIPAYPIHNTGII
jgi:hypothetical protein